MALLVLSANASGLSAKESRETRFRADFEQGDFSAWAGNDQTTVLMDFEDSQLHDGAWLLATANGTDGLIVAGKGDSGECALSLAAGQGRNGSNALLVECAEPSFGLPGFWLLKQRNDGYLANFKDDSGYLLPPGRHANRAELWVRFQPGFQATSSAAQPPTYPNHQNFHFGTYQFDPNRIDGIADVKESDNWHFYFQIWLRHDLANGDWIRVVLNEIPQHQRSLSALPPDNPTASADDFWEILTRFYFDAVPYFGAPEIEYPVRMWIDDIALHYVEETHPVEIDLLGHPVGDSVDVTMGQPRSFVLSLTNTTTNQVCGVVAEAAMWTLGVELLDGGQLLQHGGQLCLGPASSRSLELRTTPDTGAADGTKRYLGVTFVANDQFQSDATSVNRSLSDGRVERRWSPEVGPFDGVVAGDFIEVILHP